jgi:putative flippase GtrA
MILGTAPSRGRNLHAFRATAQRFLPAEMRQLVTFGLVGVVSTATHVIIALTTHKELGLQPIVANCLGYSCAFSVSYFGNARLTFRQPALHGGRFVRFVGVSLLGLALSETITYVSTTMLRLPFALALVPVVTLVPFISFVLSKSYAFAGSSEERRL